jgi:type IV pilus assembly protein PilY1
MQFGMMSGSYQKNISGGVLRRNVLDFASEVDGALATSNGKFLTSNKVGIVYNMNLLRLYGYDYSDGTYLNTGTNGDGCNFQMPGLVQSGGGSNQGDFANEGKCSSWGNPMSEIYLESLRYFAGKSPTTRYGYPANRKDKTLD